MVPFEKKLTVEWEKILSKTKVFSNMTSSNLKDGELATV